MDISYAKLMRLIQRAVRPEHEWLEVGYVMRGLDKNNHISLLAVIERYRAQFIIGPKVENPMLFRETEEHMRESVKIWTTLRFMAKDVYQSWDMACHETDSVKKTHFLQKRLT